VDATAGALVGTRIMSEHDLTFPCNGYIPPAIADGEQYQVCFIRAEQTCQWGQPKVFLWFRLITPGEWLGEEFFMACNVPPKGRWGPSHKFWQTWTLASGNRPKRGDRMSIKIFRGKVFRARIRRVTKTANQTARPPELQYSVIDQLLEVETGRGSS
jgi:hypothetical protein